MNQLKLLKKQGMTTRMWKPVLRIRIRGPFWPLNPGFGTGMDKKSTPESGMNIPDNISESLETIFWAKNT